jgi:hypothetical protein
MTWQKQLDLLMLVEKSSKQKWMIPEPWAEVVHLLGTLIGECVATAGKGANQ